MQGLQIGDMTIPQKHIESSKDNLTCIAAVENDVENGSEATYGDRYE